MAGAYKYRPQYTQNTIGPDAVTDAHKEPKTGWPSGQEHVGMPRVSIPESGYVCPRCHLETVECVACPNCTESEVES